VGIPLSALIDPGAEDADLLRRQARAFLRHDTVRIKSLDQGNEETIGAFSGNDNEAGISAFEKSFASVNSQAAFIFAAAMAFDATGFENGFNFFRKINAMVRRRRELCDLLRGDGKCEGRGTEKKKKPLYQAEHHAINNLFEIEGNNRRKKGGEMGRAGGISGKRVNNSHENTRQSRGFPKKQPENRSFQM
jgi:hypothetical protein